MKRVSSRPAKNHGQKYRPHPILPYLPLAAAALVIALVLANTKPPAPVDTITTPPENTTWITTADGIELASDIHFPSGNQPAATVILLHDFTADRHQWDPYIQQFTDAGLAVVQYDMRGFGDSRVPRLSGDRAKYLNSLVNDLPAVIEYIRRQPRLAGQLIHAVGLGLGGNIAYVASGSGLGLAQTVIISPSADDGLPDGAAIDDFAPSDIFALAATTHEADVSMLMSRATNPKKMVIIPDTDGLAVLADQTMMAEVLAWLISQ